MDFISEFLKSLNTGSGFWNPIVLLISVFIALLLVYVIRTFGNKSYKKGTEQEKAFLSGNPEYEKEQMHIRASNLYWGFTKSLDGVYKILRKMHSGNASDYVLWFVVILAIFFIIEVL